MRDDKPLFVLIDGVKLCGMPTCVRSYSKINLGLAIGAPRPDGFHSLATLYQTLALHDLVTVYARRADRTRIRLMSNDPRVPCDWRNTAWKMTEKILSSLDLRAEIKIHIQKNLPIQGGMGAGSANAAAALLGLERELGLKLMEETRLDLAAQVGSDVPLFLVGGSVLGSDRGQVVEAAADVTLDGTTGIACVIALPGIGVSTPAAFRDWDKLLAAKEITPDLHNPPIRDTIEKLSRTYASVVVRQGKRGASGILPDPSAFPSLQQDEVKEQHTPEKQQGLSREQRHSSLLSLRHSLQEPDESGIENDLAENTLLALVRTGIENDFETVVFPQYPLLREIKRQLMGSPATGNAAIYAALSGSGSALFGLYRTQTDASAAQQRLQQHGVEAIVTKTMPRASYWSEMFAE
jgi:4-diphosphocytidyl-2-C-methyl-D-erythritol kinase